MYGISELVELTGSDHDKLQKDEHWTHHLTEVKLADIVQFVTEKELENEQQTNHEQTPQGPAMIN